MNNRQRYALTHPIDEDHLVHLETCRTARDLGNDVWSWTVLAIDR